MACKHHPGLGFSEVTHASRAQSVPHVSNHVLRPDPDAVERESAVSPGRLFCEGEDHDADTTTRAPERVQDDSVDPSRHLPEDDVRRFDDLGTLGQDQGQRNASLESSLHVDGRELIAELTRALARDSVQTEPAIGLGVREGPGPRNEHRGALDRCQTSTDRIGKHDPSYHAANRELRQEECHSRHLALGQDEVAHGRATRDHPVGCLDGDLPRRHHGDPERPVRSRRRRPDHPSLRIDRHRGPIDRRGAAVRLADPHDAVDLTERRRLLFLPLNLELHGHRVPGALDPHRRKDSEVVLILAGQRDRADRHARDGEGTTIGDPHRLHLTEEGADRPDRATQDRPTTLVPQMAGDAAAAEQCDIDVGETVGQPRERPDLGDLGRLQGRVSSRLDGGAEDVPLPDPRMVGRLLDKVEVEAPIRPDGLLGHDIQDVWAVGVTDPQELHHGSRCRLARPVDDPAVHEGAGVEGRHLDLWRWRFSRQGCVPPVPNRRRVELVLVAHERHADPDQRTQWRGVPDEDDPLVILEEDGLSRLGSFSGRGLIVDVQAVEGRPDLEGRRSRREIGPGGSVEQVRHTQPVAIAIGVAAEREVLPGTDDPEWWPHHRRDDWGRHVRGRGASGKPEDETVLGADPSPDLHRINGVGRDGDGAIVDLAELQRLAVGNDDDESSCLGVARLVV